MCQDVDQHLQSTFGLPSDSPEIQPKDVSMAQEDSPERDESLDEDEDDLGSYNFGELIADEEESEEESPTAETNNQNKEKDVPEDKPTDWKCPVCSTLLPESVLLRDHLKEHYSEQDPRCPICSEIFTRASKVYPHVISVHLENKGTIQVSPKKTSKVKSPEVNKISKDSLKPCPLCKKRFRELHKHILEAHTNGRKPECPICQKPAQFKSYLKGHILSHTGELPFACSLCPLKFPIVARLNKHTRQAHGSDKMTVVKIKDKSPSVGHHKTSKRKSPVKKTILQETGHSSVEPVIIHPGLFQCPLCDKVATMSALRTHFVVHTDEKPFKCKYCDIDFTRKGSAVVHVRQFHSDKSSEKGFVLKKDSIFHSLQPWEKLGYHLKGSVTNAESKEAVKKTVSKAKRKHKMIVKPSRQASRPKCNQCKTRFLTNVQLRKHMTTHPSRATHPYECGICGNTFCTVTHRRIHQFVHSDERPFPCSECALHFKSNDHLKKHLQQAHSQTLQAPKNGTSYRAEGAVLSVEQRSKSLTCPYCDKKYAQRKSFWTHMNQHKEEEGVEGTSGERCSLCQMSFKNRSTYQQHLLRVHVVQEPRYKCTVCPKKFFKRSTLYSHKRSHEAVAPYPCKMCSKRFTYLTNLRRHVKSWHDQ